MNKKVFEDFKKDLYNYPEAILIIDTVYDKLCLLGFDITDPDLYLSDISSGPEPLDGDFNIVFEWSGYPAVSLEVDIVRSNRLFWWYRESKNSPDNFGIINIQENLPEKFLDLLRRQGKISSMLAACE